MSDDLDGGSSWITVNPSVTSRGAPSTPECLSFSLRLLPDGPTNEIKTLASPLSLPESMSNCPASVKIYVEEGSNLSRISFANVIKSLLVDLINRMSRWMAGKVRLSWLSHNSRDTDVIHGKSQIIARIPLTSESESK